MKTFSLNNIEFCDKISIFFYFYKKKSMPLFYFVHKAFIFLKNSDFEINHLVEESFIIILFPQYYHVQ